MKRSRQDYEVEQHNLRQALALKKKLEEERLKQIINAAYVKQVNLPFSDKSAIREKRLEYFERYK